MTHVAPLPHRHWDQVEDPPSIFRGARLSVFDGCCSCCRSSTDDEDGDAAAAAAAARTAAGAAAARNNRARNDDRLDNLGRLTRGEQNLNRGGGDGGGGEGCKSSSSSDGMRVFAATLGVAILARTAASLWAFGLSARAGALAGDVEGAATLAVAALVVALSGLVIEAAVGVKLRNDPSRSRGTALVTGAAAFEALGAFGVAAVLASLPYFAGDGGGDGGAAGGSYHSSAAAELWVMSAALASVGAGLMIGVTWALLPDRSAARFPYCGAFGCALIWLGLAALEVLVASFLVWAAGTAEGDRGLGRAWAAEIIGLAALEAAALVAMWAARLLWTRARLLAAVKGREGPSRRRSSGNFRSFDTV